MTGPILGAVLVAVLVQVFAVLLLGSGEAGLFVLADLLAADAAQRLLLLGLVLGRVLFLDLV